MKIIFHFDEIFFSELLSSLIVYMTKRYIMRGDSNRIKNDSFKNRPKEDLVAPWKAVKAKNHIRLNDPQLCIEFFIFESRWCNFERYQKMLDKAITKIGPFSFVFLSKSNFDSNKNLSKIKLSKSILE